MSLWNTLFGRERHALDQENAAEDRLGPFNASNGVVPCEAKEDPDEAIKKRLIYRQKQLDWKYDELRIELIKVIAGSVERRFRGPNEFTNPEWILTQAEMVLDEIKKRGMVKI